MGPTTNNNLEGVVKMGFLFSGVFWGSVLVLLGLSVIVRIVFNINVPVFRVVFALILIYLGIRVLMGGAWCRPTCGAAVFSDVNISSLSGQKEYNVIFGKGTIDATDSTITDKNRNVRINTVFGDAHIIISAKVPTVVKVSSAFSGARMPDGSTVSFGEYLYKNKAATETSDPNATRRIDVSVVFGGCTVDER
jgi:hypothetical protein